MSDKDEENLTWVVSTRNDITKAKEHWEAIRAAGQAEIKRGLEITRIANQRLQELSYLEQTFCQNLSPHVWNDNIISSTGTHLAGTISSYEQAGNRIAAAYGGAAQYQQIQHQQFLNSANNIILTSGSVVYMSAEIERRIEAINQGYRPVFEVIKPEQISSRQAIFEELRQYLDVYDPKYGYMLVGSEEALHSQGVDHLSHAAHSMRDMFQQLIEQLAPSEAVKSQPWFISTPGAPGGVSRMSRLRYMLYGASADLDEDELQRLNEAAEQAKIALDVSIARAHDHDPQLTKDEVELAIDHARFSLLEVLKRHYQRRAEPRAG